MTSRVLASQRYSIAAFLHLAVVYVVWGSTYFSVKICFAGAGSISPTQLQCVRLGFAAIIFAVIAFMRHGWPRLLSAKTICLSAVTGILMWVMGNGLSTVAARYTTSSLVVMCMGAIPLWALLLNSVMSRQIPDRKTVYAMLLGFIGLGMVVAPSLTSSGASIIQAGHEFMTLGLLMLAGLTWALGSYLQKNGEHPLPAAWFAALQLGVASLVLLVQASLDPQPFQWHYDTNQWLAFTYLVIFGSVVAFFSYTYVNNEFSPAVSSTFAYVNPIVGMGLGSAFLNESIHALSVMGMVIILGSLTLTFTAKSKRKKRRS